jgi:hypothetical protein
MSHLDIANRLAIYGYKKELEDFDYELAKIWWEHSFAKTYGTVEMLLHHPFAALNFVIAVRKATELGDMPEHEILLRLTNIRKSGYLGASKPQNF